MQKIIKSVLETISDNGFEAYIVGGFVRDYLLGKKTNDVDICTNALPKDLYKMFKINSSNNYGGFNLKIKEYNIDITTYRKELKYQNRRPTEVVYINSLEEDILRRDFTINSICMDKDEHIIDLVKGVEDLNKRVVRMQDNIHQNLIDDPLRILRAIRIATVLDFEIDVCLYQELEKNYALVKTLSKTRIKQELSKILLSPNFKKGLELLKNLKILDILNISYQEDITYVSDICGMWAQLEKMGDLTFTKQELTNIMNIRQIVEKGNIDNLTLYKYGLYNSLVASELLNISKKEINKKYSKLPIKQKSDLQISSAEIMELLNIGPSKEIEIIKNLVVEKILIGDLKNRNSEIKKYIKARKEM